MSPLFLLPAAKQLLQIIWTYNRYRLKRIWISFCTTTRIVHVKYWWICFKATADVNQICHFRNNYKLNAAKNIKCCLQSLFLWRPWRHLFPKKVAKFPICFTKVQKTFSPRIWHQSPRRFSKTWNLQRQKNRLEKGQIFKRTLHIHQLSFVFTLQWGDFIENCCIWHHYLAMDVYKNLTSKVLQVVYL